MVQIASVVAVAALLATQATAALTCVEGQKYCGSSLLQGSPTEFDTWAARIKAALIDAGQTPNEFPSSLEFDSLFTCDNKAGTALKWDAWCKKNPGTLCQPFNNDTCRNLGGGLGNKNDCCGPA